MFSHSGHVMTLANSIIGVGILAMPFCFQKCGIVLSILLLIVSNWVTRICCHYLIKSSLLTRRKSFEFLGFHTFGSSGKLLVELCIIGYLLGTCITYFVVVGDLGPQILTKMFELENGHVHLRTLFMVAVTLVCILPLGMLKNVDSLSTVCTASIGFYFCLVIKIVLESEEHILTNDWTEKVLYWEPAGVLQCLPIFSMALSCQMQLFEVFAGVNNQSLEKLNGIVRNATWICTCVYIAVGFFGYVAFCTQTFAGNILMNFSPSFGSDVIKIGFILSVAFSFPLVIFPCRASIYSLLYRKGHADVTGYIPETRFKVITAFVVTFALCIALMIPSVELIIGLVGSTIGVAICIMFPASCFRKIIKKDSTERTLAQFILVGGFCLMILGTYANLNAIDVKVSGAHLEENMVRPSQLPLTLTKQNLALLEKVIDDELKKTDDTNIQNTILNAKNSNKLLNDDNLEKLNELKVAVGSLPKVVLSSASSASPPPLPVDEIHKEQHPVEVKPNKADDGAMQSVDKYHIVSPQPDLVAIVPLEQNKSVEKEKSKDMQPAESSSSKVVPAAESSNKDAITNVTQQQNIDKDAIKKEEEIAAEELKESNKEVKAKENELKETQNELKLTKELLERKVDELKEELAKQNKETQNLVNEKLGEVVQKVEQIERKVQQQESSVEAAKDKDAAVAQQLQEKPEEPQRKNKGSLISMLSETATGREAKKEQVYEPLSYKTGELLERVAHAHGNAKLDQRLPLPLALLINASQVKLNEAAPLEQLPKDTKIILKGEPPATLLPNNVKYEKVDNKIENSNETKEKAKGMPRDILQLNPSQLEDSTKLVAPANAAERVKRAASLEAIESKLTHENCLSEPKIKLLLAHVSSGIEVDFKMPIQGIGRELKSLKEERER